jgi:hypothetical protein
MDLLKAVGIRHNLGVLKLAANEAEAIRLVCVVVISLFSLLAKAHG